MEIGSGINSMDLDLHEGHVIEDLKNSAASALPEPSRWLDEEIERNIITTTVDKLLNWGRKTSLWTETSFTACCTFEFISTSSSRFDIARFGMEVLRSSPRHADLMITAGTLTWKMAPQIKRVYEQMAEPKWVIAMGACGISGGIFADSYAVVPGYNRILPVDVYIPGCPPRPEALLAGIELLRKKIEKRSIAKGN
ncbi:MAG: NADH-quinone oxidoreductase subunit B [Dehalococcoidaceae bacterium]|nr:NADH-quinone oxidoreductase subunit B [Dehalococcoidaceae bacterium]